MFQRLDTWKQKVKEGEIKPATLLAEHNVAFQMVDHLLPLMKSVAPDPKILKDMQMKRRKCILIEESVFRRGWNSKNIEWD